MTDCDKAEFWEALNRLYVASVAIKDATEALAQTAQEQARIVLSHESRLDRAEVLIEALLEDMRRHRMSVVNIDEKSKKALDLSQAVEKRLEEALEEWRRRREGNN